MSNTTRYDASGPMDLMSDGDYVTYEDYHELEKELAESQSKLIAAEHCLKKYAAVTKLPPSPTTEKEQ